MEILEQSALDFFSAVVQLIWKDLVDLQERDLFQIWNSTNFVSLL